jgi:preprotein translocase subunit SecD
LLLVVAGCGGRARTGPAASPASPASTSGPAPIVLRFRPVLKALPAEDHTESTPADQDDPASQVVLTEQDGDNVVARYLLGPAFLTNDAIADAEPVDNGGWSVNLQLKPGLDGIDTFNRSAQACFVGAPTCPPIGPGGHGMIAIVLDSVVMATPEIEPDQTTFSPFNGDQIAIGGTLTEAEARQLAQQLR